MSFISAHVLHLYYLTVHTILVLENIIMVSTLTCALGGVTVRWWWVDWVFFNRYVIGILAYNIGDTDNICDTDILSLRFYRAMLRIAQW